jgi:hypothetical protein
MVPYSDYWTPVRIYRHKHVLPNPAELERAKAQLAQGSGWIAESAQVALVAA